MMIGVSAGRPAPARINSLSRLWRWPSIARGGADDDCPPPWTDCLLCYGTVFSTEKRHTDISTRNNHGVVHVCCSNSFLHSVYHGVRAAAIGLNFFSLSLFCPLHFWDGHGLWVRHSHSRRAKRAERPLAFDLLQ
jgi:hypothetical protein